jgi:hypothetical protein
MMFKELPPITNVQDLAALLECSERTVRDYANSGMLPGMKFGEDWIFATHLIVDAVAKLSLLEAEKRAAKKPAPAVAVSVGVAPKPGRKSTRRVPPGMTHLSPQAIGEILTPQ